MKDRYAAFAALTLMSSTAFAQQPAAPAASAPAAAPTSVATPAVAVAPTTAPAPAPAEASAPAEAAATLPANSEVVLTLNEAISSENLRLGDRVALTVAQDVKVGGNVVIPHGTRAVGQVTMHKGRGSFGKSGKMAIDFRYVDFEGRHIPVDGHYLQEGQGNGAAAVGAVLAAGVIGGLIVHGKSARIAEGHEFTVHTVDSIPVTLSGSGAPALIAASYTPSPVNLNVMTDKERKAAEKAAGKAAAAAQHAAGNH